MRPPAVITQPSPQAPPVRAPPPAPPVVAAPTRPTPPVEGDLAAYVQARRRERGEQEAALNDEAAQFNRAIAANLPAPARGVAAQEAKRGGGIFQIKRMTYDDAAFEFYGWNKEMGRRTPQLIEVRKGDNADMRIAVVWITILQLTGCATTSGSATDASANISNVEIGMRSGLMLEQRIYAPATINPNFNLICTGKF